MHCWLQCVGAEASSVTPIKGAKDCLSHCADLKTVLAVMDRLAETRPAEPVCLEYGSPSFAGVPMKPDNRPLKIKRRQSIPAANT